MGWTVHQGSSPWFPCAPLVSACAASASRFDRAEVSPVALGGELGHGPGGLVEVFGFSDPGSTPPGPVPPLDQPVPVEHAPGAWRRPACTNWRFSGQPAGADRAVADQEVEDRRRDGWDGHDSSSSACMVIPAVIGAVLPRPAQPSGPGTRPSRPGAPRRSGPAGSARRDSLLDPRQRVGLGVAFGCQRELHEHRVAGHRLLPAGDGSVKEKRVGGSTTSWTGPPWSPNSM